MSISSRFACPRRVAALAASLTATVAVALSAALVWAATGLAAALAAAGALTPAWLASPAVATPAESPARNTAAGAGTEPRAGEATRSRRFEFRYEAVIRDVPASARAAYLWIPHPAETEDQSIRNLRVTSSMPHTIVAEPRYGNRAFRFEARPGAREEKATLEFEVTRRERIRRPDAGPSGAPLAGVSPGGVPPVRNGAAGPDVLTTASAGQGLAADRGPSPEDPKIWLESDRRVPINGRVRRWALETVGGRVSPLEKARAIYDYVVGNLKYDKSGTGWGQGDIFWACDARRGNCTDFHAVFIGYSRALGIPAKFEMGFPIPIERGGGEIGGYHCWAQFWLEEMGWVPVDASEANQDPARREYFFGAHDENRVLFSVGRDLAFPGMKGEPLNFFIYPYAEVDGAEHPEVERGFLYRDLDPKGGAGR